jgi:hypothetical protein
VLLSIERGGYSRFGWELMSMTDVSLVAKKEEEEARGRKTATTVREPNSKSDGTRKGGKHFTVQ